MKNEKYKQNESINEVVSYDDKKFIIVKTDKSIHILTEVQLQELAIGSILLKNDYSPEKYSQILNEFIKN